MMPDAKQTQLNDAHHTLLEEKESAKDALGAARRALADLEKTLGRETPLIERTRLEATFGHLLMCTARVQFAAELLTTAKERAR